MGDFSNITYAQVETYASELKSAATRMEEILNAVKGEFNKVDSAGVWSGDAAGSVRAEFDQLSTKFPEFSKAVNECANHLNSVVANYKAADQSVMNP